MAKYLGIRVYNKESKQTLVVHHSVDSFLALAWALVSLTFISLALWTILSLYTTKFMSIRMKDWTKSDPQSVINTPRMDLNVCVLVKRSTYLFPTETLLAISPQKILLFMRRSSMSASLEMSIFLNPLAKKCLVLWSCLLPIFGSFIFPLNLLLVEQSIPLMALWEFGCKNKLLESCEIYLRWVYWIYQIGISFDAK